MLLEPGRLGSLSIEHPRFVYCRDLTFALADLSPRPTILELAGPTQVGKTRIMELLDSRLNGQHQDSDHIACVRIECIPSHGARMSLKFLYYLLLKELKHPFYVNADDRVMAKTTENIMLSQVEHAIQARRTTHIIADEAHHLLKTRCPELGINLLDVMKSLTNKMRVVLILSGGYQLYVSSTVSAHFSGRVERVHFSRYTLEGDDRTTFEGILAGLDLGLAWAARHSLVSNIETIHAGCQGCVGLLLRWVSSALTQQRVLKDRLLTIEHFVQRRMEDDLRVILDDIERGESLIVPMGKTRCARSRDDTASARPPRRQSKPRKPFARSLGRDKVGV